MTLGALGDLGGFQRCNAVKIPRYPRDPWCCYIWQHESHQYTPFMLAYIPAPWILWEGIQRLDHQKELRRSVVKQQPEASTLFSFGTGLPWKDSQMKPCLASAEIQQTHLHILFMDFWCQLTCPISMERKLGIPPLSSPFLVAANVVDPIKPQFGMG